MEGFGVYGFWVFEVLEYIVFRGLELGEEILEGSVLKGVGCSRSKVFGCLGFAWV